MEHNQNAAPGNGGQNQPQKISAQAFSAKFKSKREVYNFLTIDLKAYLPPPATITIYHMKDLVSGRKRVSPPPFSLPWHGAFLTPFSYSSWVLKE